MSRVARTEAARVLSVTTVPMSFLFMRGLAAALARRGMKAEFATSPGSGIREFEAAESVSVHTVPMQRRVSPLRDIQAIARMRSVIRRVRPAVVAGHTPKGGMVALAAASLARVPVRVYHLRGLRFETASGIQRALLRRVEQATCALAHEVICVSESVRAEAVLASLGPAGKFVVLGGGSGQGVDADETFNPARLASHARATARAALGFEPDALVIGFVGRVVRDKGIVELTAAWSQLRARHPSARLMLVGPFETEDPIPAECEAALRADERVCLLGARSDLPVLYSAMDLVVLPTYREGFPNVPLEAAAMELPVVATRVTGCVDAVVDGVTGSLVPARSADALAASIDMYLADPALRRSHGSAGRARVMDRFRREVVLDRTAAEYRRLLDARA